MLNFIFGLPKTAKSFTVFEKIKSDVENGKEVVLFVPEQLSFETEKSVLRLLGNGYTEKISVLSFTRLFDVLTEAKGGICGKTLSDTEKIVLMNRVLTSPQVELSVWGKYAHSLSFAKTILDTLGEFKINAITPYDIKKAAAATDRNSLKLKLLDIALIFEGFEALLGEKFIDPVDKLTKVYRELLQFDFFINKNVYFDSFKAFTGQQFKIIDRILSQADEVYFTFNNDLESNNEFDIFTVLRKNILKIEAIAKKHGIKASKPIILKTPYYENQSLQRLERLMAGNTENYDLSDCVTVCKAKTPYDEVEFVFRKIRQLVREENYRFKDFAIIARESERYTQAIQYISRKNDVSCFFDKRVALSTLPFCFAVNSAIEALSFDTDAILRFHKCGFTTLSPQEISSLENYAFLWNINAKKWLEDFFMNPRGFNADQLSDADLEEINRLNRLRKAAIEPIVEFKNSFHGNARQMAAAIVNLLEKADAKSLLKGLCERFEAIGSDITPDILKQGYDSFMAVLDGLAVCFGDKTLTQKEFSEALSIALSTETVGVIPQFIDEVSFGDADRIQLTDKKIVFVLGANQDVFPKGVTNNGIWALNERKKLIELGLEMSDNSLLSAIDEDYLVYSALTSAAEKLFITYASESVGGEELFPSAFVNSICQSLSPTLCSEPCPLSDALPETEASVFAEICRRFKQTNDAATLNAALPEKHIFDNISSSVNNNLNRITSENAQRLYGNNISLSATKIDTVNRCKFSYFCKYGLRTERLQAADFNVLQRGTIAHYVLEKIISDYKEKVANLTESEISALTDGYINEYLSKIKGFDTIRNARIDFLLSKISRSLKEVVLHIAADFKQSDFKPVACEFKIGMGDGLPLEFPYDKGKISINGSIDRVDEFNGFIRIVDYKTGSKTFKLPDILYGLNLQMLIYLYALIRGKGLSDDKAAAILYMPAKRDIKDEGLAMNGLLKADLELITAMEKQNKGEFVPKLPIKKDGSIGKKGSFIGEDGFSEIFDFIEKYMKKTGNLIASGDISVEAVDGRESPACKYCDFKSVCFVDDGNIKKVPDLSNDKVFEIMKEAEI